MSEVRSCLLNYSVLFLTEKLAINTFIRTETKSLATFSELLICSFIIQAGVKD